MVLVILILTLVFVIIMIYCVQNFITYFIVKFEVASVCQNNSIRISGMSVALQIELFHGPIFHTVYVKRSIITYSELVLILV